MVARRARGSDWTPRTTSSVRGRGLAEHDFDTTARRSGADMKQMMVVSGWRYWQRCSVTTRRHDRPLGRGRPAYRLPSHFAHGRTGDARQDRRPRRPQVTMGRIALACTSCRCSAASELHRKVRNQQGARTNWHGEARTDSSMSCGRRRIAGGALRSCRPARRSLSSCSNAE